jgi:DNA polymerase-4
MYPDEIPRKFWSLPVRELFLAGPRVVPRLYRLNIFSIGHLAQAEPALLERHLGALGPLLWQFANGFDHAPVQPEPAAPKAIGNATSTPYNVDAPREALLFLHAVGETAATRLRAAGLHAQVVTVGFRTASLAYITRQGRLGQPTDHTATLLARADQLFLSRWDGTPLRHFGISFSELSGNTCEQMSLFGETPAPQARRLDQCVDSLRHQYGNQSVMRGGFVASGIPPMAGGPQGNAGTAADEHLPPPGNAVLPNDGAPHGNAVLRGPWPKRHVTQGRDDT